MSTHNICFYGEIRKIGVKKDQYLELCEFDWRTQVLKWIFRVCSWLHIAVGEVPFSTSKYWFVFFFIYFYFYFFLILHRNIIWVL